MTNTTTVLVGTTKGAFLVDGDAERGNWQVRGPFCDGWPINHVVADETTGAIWAGGGGDFHGAGVWRSEDGGESWTLTRLSAGEVDDWAASDPEVAGFFGWLAGDPPPFGKAFSQVWSLNAAHGRLHAGTKPATLLVSSDGGDTFAWVDGLSDHPSRPDWNGGAAGLVLHTILPDPGDATRMWVAISAAGVFATEDGGTTWERRNRLSNAESCADHDHPAAPRYGRRPAIRRAQYDDARSDGTLYQQKPPTGVLAHPRDVTRSVSWARYQKGQWAWPLDLRPIRSRWDHSREIAGMALNPS